MDFEDFRKEFIEEVRADAIVSGIGSVASFVQTASAYMLNADVFPDAITPAFFEGEGKRNRKLRIDGYLFDPADNTMNLFIADYDSVERNNPMIKTLAQGLFKKIEYFILVPPDLRSRALPFVTCGLQIRWNSGTEGGSQICWNRCFYCLSFNSSITFKRYWPYWFFSIGWASSRIFSGVIQPWRRAMPSRQATFSP